jgi:hypothetical protein
VKGISFKKTGVKLALAAATVLGLGSCGLLGNVGGGGPVVTGVVAGTATPGTDYRLALVRYSLFGPGGTELEAAQFLNAFSLTGGTGAYTGSLPKTIDLGADTRAYFRVVVYDDINDDDKYDRNATNSAGGKDRILTDSANGKADGGDRYLVYAIDNQDLVAGKPLGKGWNLVVDVNRDTNLSLGTGTADDAITQTLTGLSISY